MPARLSRWGVGPQIAAAALGYAVLAGAASRRWPNLCLLRWLPFGVDEAIAGILLVAGVAMLMVAARSVMRAYNRDQLITSGVFGLVRHPVYSAWIVFLVPALGLLSRSWPVLLTPLAAYAAFKRLIHREDEYLQQRFGQAYLDYRASVSELIPRPRASRPRHKSASA